MNSKFLCTDVLAIRCIGNFIFIGIGCTLHVYNIGTYKLEKKIRCLYPYNIHGIVNGPSNKLAVYGANLIRLYNVNIEDNMIMIKECSTIKHLSDWIIAVNWLEIKGCLHLSVLLAHNNIELLNTCNEHHRSVWCEEKCILYGGSISVKSNNDLVIFSGTVFQEILIWEIKQDSCSETSSVLHRLIGHNGVIFSVIYDPITQLICSTSDDRTVRLWKPTANCNAKNNESDWGEMEVQLIKTMFGHTARVWRCIIRNDSLITIGEDSLICTWSLDGRLLNKVCAHHGAAIWSIDITDNNENMFTGGADGAVHAWSLMTDYVQNTISLPKNDVQSVLKCISYLSSLLLIFTEDGILYSYDRTTNYLRGSTRLKRYNGYCIMQVSPCRSYVSFAFRDGYLTIYKEATDTEDKDLERILEEEIMKSQILSMQWLKSDMILICGGNGMLKLLNFTSEGVIETHSTYTLPMCRERWLTAAIIFAETLVCGDRTGNMHVFQLQKSINDRADIVENKNIPIQTLSRVHGKIGVQSFTILGSKLISAGRDGTLRFYELRGKDSVRSLYTLHRERMPMDWISGTLKTSDDILALGFKEVEFVIYSMLYHRIVASIPCGGGHRSWDCMLVNNLIKFAYIRNKQVFIFNSPLRTSKPPILLNDFHAKEVYSLQPLMQIGSQQVFLSGGEDGTLRVTSIQNLSDNFSFNTLGVLDGHISSIKTIATINRRNPTGDISCNKHLIFSGGGRAQMKVWEIDIKQNKNETQNIDISCSDLTSHMLYGLDRHRRKPWQESNLIYAVQPETRYMDIEIYRPSKNSRYTLLFVACADGFVRTFFYDTDTNSVQLITCTKCVDRCILKIAILTYSEKIIVLTMSTDGVVRFIDFTDIVSKIFNNTLNENQEFPNSTGEAFAKFNLHKSGINSFDLKMITESEYLLATGGDDNLFSLISFKVSITSCNNGPSVSLLSKWNTSSAHSAQITGIKFEDQDKIFSVGVDQRIITYSYDYSNGILSAKILNDLFTFVTDVQGLVLWPSTETNKSFACVYGKGFEVLSW